MMCSGSSINNIVVNERHDNSMMACRDDNGSDDMRADVN